MPLIRLPSIDQKIYEMPIEKQVRALGDYFMRYRRESEYLLNGKLDSANGVNSTVGDLTDVWTAINQTETDIDLLAGDVSGNTAAINVNAQAITLKVSSTDYNGGEIISKINLTSSTVLIQSGRIDLIGATTLRTGSSNDYINFSQNVITVNEYASGLAKLAIGFVPDKDGVNIPAIVLGAGDGHGNNRGYITKDADSLDLFHISSAGLVSFISLGNGEIRLNDKIIPVADQNGKLIDGYINSATSWNAKLDEITIQTKLQDPDYNITIPKENIGVLGSGNIDYASITTAVIQNLTVDTAQIVNLAVTTAKINDAAITTAKIGSLQVTTANIDTLAVTDAKIASLAVTTAKIADLAVESAKIGSLAVTTAKIDDLAVTRAKIGSAAIGSAEIDSAVITYAHIANATIKTANIESAAITTALIATSAIETAQIKDGSITDAKIVELTANKINAGTLSVERLVIRDPVTPANSLIYAINNISGALQSVQGDTLNGEILTSRSITADRIVAGAITANEIAAATITANKMAVGTITAASGIIASIDASVITSGSISANRISGGTISGVTINVSTTGTFGNEIRLGGESGLRFVNSSGYHVYLSSTEIMKFYSNCLYNYGSIAISSGSSVGTINAGGYSGGIYFTQNELTVFTSGSAAVFRVYGHLYHAGSRIGFFNTAATTKATVGDPAAITSSAPGSSYSQTTVAAIRTDVVNVQAKLLTLINALQAYGLIA